MKKSYRFTYELAEASAAFVVDTEKFTPELAKITLDFYGWDYEDEDLVDKVMFKYALQAIRIATQNRCGIAGVIEEWEFLEGFHRIDSPAIQLTEVTGYEINEDNLEMTITEG
jgi:hypothetical protein